jgi:hypothetical protein
MCFDPVATMHGVVMIYRASNNLASHLSLSNDLDFTHRRLNYYRNNICIYVIR